MIELEERCISCVAAAFLRRCGSAPPHTSRQTHHSDTQIETIWQIAEQFAKIQNKITAGVARGRPRAATEPAATKTAPVVEWINFIATQQSISIHGLIE